MDKSGLSIADTGGGRCVLDAYGPRDDRRACAYWIFLHAFNDRGGSLWRRALAQQKPGLACWPRSGVHSFSNQTRGQSIHGYSASILLCGDDCVAASSGFVPEGQEYNDVVGWDNDWSFSLDEERRIVIP